ncbi:MAG: hypothetical protein WD689_02985 [Gaiellaceae bacterium]
MTSRSSAALRALNETRVREVNEEIARANRRFGSAPNEQGLAFHVLCECGTRGCAELLDVEAAAFEAVRTHPGRFLVVAGHDLPEIERVVERTEQFAVVEKIGAARAVAQRTDPRNPHSSSAL